MGSDALLVFQGELQVLSHFIDSLPCLNDKGVQLDF